MAPVRGRHDADGIDHCHDGRAEAGPYDVPCRLKVGSRRRGLIHGARRGNSIFQGHCASSRTGAINVAPTTGVSA